FDDSIAGPEEELRRIFETNSFGTLRVSNAFAPVLAANGGGTLLNILSAAAWVSMPTGHAASKAAMWSATNALRTQLRGQSTHVIGLLVGMIDTPMTAGGTSGRSLRRAWSRRRTTRSGTGRSRSWPTTRRAT
ncbi:MAG: SDR family NAD(P)-dependent oxidoreductase, partial [Janthinobacterium lividum]